MLYKCAALMALLCAGPSSIAQIAFPTQKGVVSDYAGWLTAAQIEELSGIIKQYERQTTIEFAVVVVDSLQGYSAKEYAQGIGDRWGVGKRGQNNGVVLLLAPNERSYSLRIADGLSPDLGDADAVRITRDSLVPYLKRSEYYDGIKDTVLATMQQLGREHWNDRLQNRARATRASQEAERSTEENVAAGGVALVLAIAAGLIVYRSRKRKQKLAEMAEARTSISADLLLAGRNALQIRQLLDDFKAEMPEQKIEDVSSDLALQPTRIAKVKNDAALLNFANLEEYDRAICVKDSAESEAGLLERTRERLSRIRKAKEDSGVLMEHLSREKFAIPHVRDSTKQEEVDGLLLRGQQMYDQARTRSSDPLLDWLLIHELLYGSQDSMQRALESSQAEPYMPSLSSFDASGSGGSVFGDSGGTDFGGGGGFSGGSGSDGTY